MPASGPELQRCACCACCWCGRGARQEAETPPDRGHGASACALLLRAVCPAFWCARTWISATRGFSLVGDHGHRFARLFRATNNLGLIIPTHRDNWEKPLTADPVEAPGFTLDSFVSNVRQLSPQSQVIVPGFLFAEAPCALPYLTAGEGLASREAAANGRLRAEDARNEGRSGDVLPARQTVLPVRCAIADDCAAARNGCRRAYPAPADLVAAAVRPVGSGPVCGAAARTAAADALSAAPDRGQPGQGDGRALLRDGEARVHAGGGLTATQRRDAGQTAPRPAPRPVA